MEFLFLIFGKIYVLISSVCTSLHPHQQCRRVTFFSKNLASISCLVHDNRHSYWHKNGSVVLICISLIAKDVEHFFRMLIGLCITSETFQFISVAHFLIGHILEWSSFFVLYVV